MTADEANWHPLCLSASVEPSTSAGVRLYDKELVVWRDAGGEAHVWEDRCPHRGMKLSLGFVRGDHLACLYHGWQYDTSGRCRHIPAHPDLDVPATISVPAYKTREWAGIIWATLQAGHEADDTIETLATTPVRSIYIDLRLDAALFALLALGLGESSAINRLESNICLIKAAGDQLICAFQPVSKTRTAMHLVICGSAGPEKLRHYALELENLRHRIETGAIADV